MGKLLIWILLFGFWPWSSPPLQVIRASSETFYPGRKESPVTTQYAILIVAGKSSRKLVVDRVYIKGKSYSVRLYCWPGEKPIESFSKKDTLLVRATWFESGHAAPEKTKSLLPALARQHDVVLSFKIHHKRKYIPVENITRLPDNINL